MNWGIFWTVIGCSIGLLAIIHQFFRNFKSDIKLIMENSDKRILQLDNRIFQLAMGKTLKEVMTQEKEEEEKVK